MKARDTEAFVAFVRSRESALLRTAYLMVGERGLAQDLVQEALTNCYAAWPRLREPNAGEAYVRTAITRTAISWYRKRSWAGERPTDELPERSTPGHEDSVTRHSLLWTALMELPPRQRAIVVCRYYDDLTEAQTAAHLGCALGTVKSQAHAALTTLRTRLAEAGVDAELASELMEMAR